MSATLTVTFSYPKDSEPASQAYTLIVEVTAAEGLPKEIFVFQADAYPGAGEGTAADASGFIKVASVVDLDEYPINTPDMVNEVPYFRRAKATLLFRDIPTLEETKKMIFNDINALVRAKRSQDAVPVQEEVTFDGSQTFIDIPWDSGPLS